MPALTPAPTPHMANGQAGRQSNQLITDRNEHTLTHTNTSRDQRTPDAARDHGAPRDWISIHWDGRVAAAAGMTSWERRTPGGHHFAGWRWDGTRLSLASDRLGMIPLYYWLHDTGIAVAPTVHDLLRLGAPRTIDWDALGVFLQVGWYQAEDTPFRSIRMIPPGSSSWWQDGRFHLSGGPTIVPAGRAVPRGEAIATYSRLFSEAIEDSAPGSSPILLPLSGGRDSRHILLELVRAGTRPERCFTYGVSTRHPEWRSASLLATRVGVAHDFVPLPPVTLAGELRKNVMSDFGTDEHIHYVTLADAMRATQDGIAARCVMYDGIAGDVLSEPRHLTPERARAVAQGDWRTIARSFALTADPRAMLRIDVWDRLPPVADSIERISTEIERHRLAASPLASYRFWNRTRREVGLAPMRILGSAIPVHTPFLYPPLFDWLTQLPMSMLNAWPLHTETILTAYPNAADVPFAESFTWTASRLATSSLIAELSKAAVGRMTRPGAPEALSLPLRYTSIIPRLVASRLHRRYRWHEGGWLRLVLYLQTLGSFVSNDQAITSEFLQDREVA